MESFIIIGAVIVLAFVLIRFIKRFSSSIIGVLLVVAVALGWMYHKSIGPFKKNLADITVLVEKYCGTNGDEDICDCIIMKAKEDISTRFSEDEVKKLSEEKIKAVYILQKSLKSTKEEALMCLAAKGETNKYKEFLQDFVPIENKYLDMLGVKARKAGDKLKDEVQNAKEKKEEVDDRY